mmetsp:Transcript_42677/g.134653  ORF Transcript_42677/g.134653 Transcript_42677/m.134653 type:complete len:202 (+) Transcript_42677:747-1352(+)
MPRVLQPGAAAGDRVLDAEGGVDVLKLLADGRDGHARHHLHLAGELEVEGRLEANVDVRVDEVLAAAAAVAGIQQHVEEGEPDGVAELRQRRRRRDVEALEETLERLPPHVRLVLGEDSAHHLDGNALCGGERRRVRDGREGNSLRLLVLGAVARVEGVDDVREGDRLRSQRRRRRLRPSGEPVRRPRPCLGGGRRGRHLC